MPISKVKTKSISLSSVNSDIILNNTVQFIDLSTDVSSNILDTKTTTQSNSANWQTAYAYVSANSLNQGTLIDWMTLVRGYKTTPTLLATIGTGDVYTYVYATTGTDKTYYRYIATDGSEDSFYGNFTNPTLSNLITTKKIIL